MRHSHSASSHCPVVATQHWRRWEHELAACLTRELLWQCLICGQVARLAAKRPKPPESGLAALNLKY